MHSGSVTRKQRQHLGTQLLHTLDGVWRWISLQEQEDLQLDSLLTFILSSENSVYLGAEEAEEHDHAYSRARKSILGDAQLGGGHAGPRSPRKSLAPHRARGRASVAP